MALNGVVKQSDETRTSDGATFANDAELLFSTAANTAYRLQAALDVEAHSTPDFKWRFAHGGTTSQFLGAADQLNTTGTASSRTAGPYMEADLTAGTGSAMNGSATAGLHGAVLCDGILVTGGSGGTFSVQWAQNTSSGNITRVFAGSYLIWEEITPDSLIVVKSANENRSSTTALADDSELILPLDVGDYLITGCMTYYSPATPDFKYAFAFSGTSSILKARTAHRTTMSAVGNIGAYTEPADVHFTSTELGTAFVVNGTATSTDRGYTRFKSAIRVSAAGTFSFQWAQNTSDGGTTTVHENSWLIAERVS